jgi:hypothetical protein
LAVVVVRVDAEQEIGRLSGRNRGDDLGFDVVVRRQIELDLLPAMLLEGGDDLPDRRILLGVEALLPQHDEVGGLCAEGRHDDRCGKNDGASAHRGDLPHGRGECGRFSGDGNGKPRRQRHSRVKPLAGEKRQLFCAFRLERCAQRTLWDGKATIPTAPFFAWQSLPDRLGATTANGDLAIAVENRVSSVSRA